MSSRVLTVMLLVITALSLASLGPGLLARHLPGNDQGYEPVQPIAFSHRLHGGELQIDCLYCHSGADKSRYAGIPAASVCMNCHKSVRATFGAVRAEDERARAEKRDSQPVLSPEIRKIYAALGLDENTLLRDAARPLKPIAWVRVHKLPDFVYFNHSAHVNAGVKCQQCHGPVETMERVRQMEDLSMGWCVNCHRDAARNGVNGRAVQPSTDCATCHY